MTAKLIESTPQPFSRIDIDPITLDIIENALRNARYEMDAVLFRTAMSPGIREQHDEFPMIANVEGKMVVGQFGSFIYGFLEGFDGTVEEARERGYVTTLLGRRRYLPDIASRNRTLRTASERMAMNRSRSFSEKPVPLSPPAKWGDTKPCAR